MFLAMHDAFLGMFWKVNTESIKSTVSECWPNEEDLEESIYSLHSPALAVKKLWTGLRIIFFLADLPLLFCKLHHFYFTEF